MMSKVSKRTVKDAVERKNKEEKRREMENSKKVGDRLSDNPQDNSYLAEMSLPKCRIWMRHRARMIKGVKYNIKRSYKDLSCRFCVDGGEETQEHLEVCVGCEYERRGLRMIVKSDILWFWRRMEVKIMEKKLMEKKEVEEDRNKIATVT